MALTQAERKARYNERWGNGLLCEKQAQKVANLALKHGLIKKTPCEICGKARSEMHHPDYRKPFTVQWLCRTHHRQHHWALKKKKPHRRVATPGRVRNGTDRSSNSGAP